jgi:hypothetical protein
MYNVNYEKIFIRIQIFIIIYIESLYYIASTSIKYPGFHISTNHWILI